MKQEMIGVVVASGEPHTNHLHLAPDITMLAPHQLLAFYVMSVI